MAQLVVRNLEDEVKARLRQRAARHGRSMEEEIRDILRDAVKDEGQSREPLGSRIAARFSGCSLDVDVPEQRGASVQPASFE